MKALSYIKVSDDIRFNYNYEALNACFGTNMRETLRKSTWDSKAFSSRG